MALSITELAERLREITAWQHTPVDLSYEDYAGFVQYGIRKLFIDTGRATSYNRSLITVNPENGEITYDGSFYVDEEEYILLLAQIAFFQKVAADVNNIVGYTTNALSVTNADKPYANLKDTLDKLENERRITFYKMVRFVL